MKSSKDLVVGHYSFVIKQPSRKLWKILREASKLAKLKLDHIYDDAFDLPKKPVWKKRRKK